MSNTKIGSHAALQKSIELFQDAASAAHVVREARKAKGFDAAKAGIDGAEKHSKPSFAESLPSHPGRSPVMAQIAMLQMARGIPDSQQVLIDGLQAIFEVTGWDSKIDVAAICGEQKAGTALQNLETALGALTDELRKQAFDAQGVMAMKGLTDSPTVEEMEAYADAMHKQAEVVDLVASLQGVLRDFNELRMKEIRNIR